MLIRLGEFDFTEVWDGVLYRRLSGYPGITPWEKRTLAEFVAYEQAMEEIRQELSSFCTSRGADYITICTDQPVEKVLFKELLKVGIMA